MGLIEKVKKFRCFLFGKNSIPKPVSIRMATIFIVYDKIGRPREEGALMQAEMKSGRTAVYKLVGITRAWNADWDWLDWEFDHYLKDGEGPYPKYC